MGKETRPYKSPIKCLQNETKLMFEKLKTNDLWFRLEKIVQGRSMKRRGRKSCHRSEPMRWIIWMILFNVDDMQPFLFAPNSQRCCVGPCLDWLFIAWQKSAPKQWAHCKVKAIMYHGRTPLFEERCLSESCLFLGNQASLS